MVAGFYTTWYWKLERMKRFVAPLFLAVLLFSNMVCGPTLLREQYRSYEVQLTLVCLLMILAAAYVESQIFNGKMSIRLVNLQNIQNGEGWAITFSIIGFFLAFGYYGWTVIHHQLYSRERFCSDASPFDFYSNAMLGYSSAVPVR
ncbi:unnamed protein product [Effrenium voratum]|nr:unnamed protein product [Effrenium voratum]